MTSFSYSRRDFSIQLAAAVSGLGLARKAFARSGPLPAAPAAYDVSHTAEAIHQEVMFKASPKRVYDALTDAKQFDKVIQLSAARMAPDAKPAEISRETGGAFSLFGGYIVGRQLELLTNQRLVQAWRAGSWSGGVYSIARFELTDQDSGTKLVFDHTGFPQGAGQHLAEGWKANYWDPLAKYLAG
jgi:activator of HSP90 ATPase